MSTKFDVTQTLDVKGESCPMPVIKTRKAVDGMAPDEVLEVLATDPGSVSDVAGWADGTPGVELLDQFETDEDGRTIYKHYVRRTEDG